MYLILIVIGTSNTCDKVSVLWQKFHIYLNLYKILFTRVMEPQL